MRDKKNKEKSTVYVPPNAEPNYSNGVSAPPNTEYKNRQWVYNMEEIKKLTKGKYGKYDAK